VHGFNSAQFNWGRIAYFLASSRLELLLESLRYQLITVGLQEILRLRSRRQKADSWC